MRQNDYYAKFKNLRDMNRTHESHQLFINQRATFAPEHGVLEQGKTVLLVISF